MKKNFLCWIVILLCSCCMSVALAMDMYYDRLLDADKFRPLDRPTVHRMQRNLAVIYQHDHDWMRDVALSQHPLTDGLMGPVTLFWLQRFIFDFKIAPVGNYVTETRIRLEYLASFANMFPKEGKVLISTDFAHWNDDQPELQKNLYYSVRRSGSDQALLDLVDLYRRVAEPLPESVSAGKNQLTAYYYQLTAEDFKILQGKDQIQAQLSKLVNKQFDNVSALQAAMAETLKDYPGLVDKLLPVMQRYYRYADPVISQSFLDLLMGDALFTSLNSVLTTLLDKSLSGVAYPDNHLFDQAVKSKVYAGLGACQDASQQNAYLSGLRINDEDLEKLAENLLTGPYQGMPNFSQQLKQIGLLRMRQKGDCAEEDLVLINEFVTGLYEHAIQPAIVLLYRKKPEYSAASPIQWNGDGCGCVLDYLSGTVYGFYPFWLANGEVQTVNFSVLSRVAYYGLSFDNKGIIKQTNILDDNTTILPANGAEKNLQTAFIQTARKYTSKVDWVIHNNKTYWDRWKTLTYAAKVTVLETLTESIVNLLTSQITDDFSKIKQNMTLGVMAPPTRGDGVTLYFNDYPVDPESVGLFNRFFLDLQKKLLAEDNEYFINILLPQSALDTGIYQYSNLLDWINNTKTADTLAGNVRDDLKTKILVLIEEPTTDSKKKLRLDVDNSKLHGVERGLLLRNIIPVIEFDGRNWKQLEDDIVYFKDNFGGIGFWPLMVDRRDEINSVSGYLVRYFQNATWHGEPESFLEKVVCENRAYFRIALGLLTVLCLLFSGLYFYSCCIHNKIRNFYVLYLIIIIIPTLTVALLLLTYDPALEPVSTGNLPLIMVVFGGIAISIIVYLRQKKKMRKPSRPRIQAS